jgi:enoyl-CoA hydratase
MIEIIVEKTDKVVSVIIDRPPVNALTIALYQRIAEVFEEIGTLNDVNCAVLLARGSRAFCAGLDLREYLAAKVEDDQARAVIVRRMFHSVRHCAIPVIAAVNGPALGAGCVLASVCDIRIASENATFRIARDQCRPLRRHCAHGASRPAGAAAPDVLHRYADQRAGGVSRGLRGQGGAARAPDDGGQ